jgi:hypothetical protein
MKQFSNRMQPKVVSIWAIALLTSGCSGYVRQSAVNAIAAQIQPHAAIVISRLESSSNPAGEGVIVFVRSDSSCAPRYAWLWLNRRTNSFALDDASRELTPQLNTLSDAPGDILKRIGTDGGTFRDVVRASVCHATG